MSPGDPVRLLVEWRWSDLLEPLPAGLCGYAADLPWRPGCVVVDFGREMGGFYEMPERLLELDAQEASAMAKDGLDRRDVLGQPDQSGERVLTVGGRV